MKQIVLQIAKSLNIFTLDEIAMIAECENTENILCELIKDRKIKKFANGSYKIFNEHKTKPKQTVQQIYFTQKEIKQLQEERKKLTDLHPRILSKIDKYLKLLIEANNLKGEKLRYYINNVWNVQNPEMKSSVTTFRRNRKKLKDMGIQGLIPAGITIEKQTSIVSDEIYKIFREYLSKNTDKTLKRSYEDFKSKFFKDSPDFERWLFPSYSAITIRINKDYSQKHIFRDKKAEFKTFKEASINYIETIESENKLKPSTLKEHKGHIRQHLLPFFKGINLDNISKESIEDYKKFVIFSGIVSPNGLRKQLYLLKKILKEYSCNKLEIQAGVLKIEKDYQKYL